MDTFGHILEKMGKLDIPNLQNFGMLNLHTAGEMKPIREKAFGKIYTSWRGEQRKRYNDGALGDDGNQNRKTIHHLY